MGSHLEPVRFLGYIHAMKPLIYALLSVFYVGLSTACVAHAQNKTPWIKQNVVEARLVLARDGKQHFAGIEIIMQPGWHTYWSSTDHAGISMRKEDG